MRTGHEAVGKLVAECEQRKCRLQDLSLAEIKSLVPATAAPLIDDSVSKVLGSANAAAALVSYGSGSRERVKEQLAEWKKRLNDVGQATACRSRCHAEASLWTGLPTRPPPADRRSPDRTTKLTSSCPSSSQPSSSQPSASPQLLRALRFFEAFFFAGFAFLRSVLRGADLLLCRLAADFLNGTFTFDDALLRALASRLAGFDATILSAFAPATPPAIAPTAAPIGPTAIRRPLRPRRRRSSSFPPCRIRCDLLAFFFMVFDPVEPSVLADWPVHDVRCCAAGPVTQGRVAQTVHSPS